MTDNLVKPLVVDGVTLPMHSTYAFELQKVYVSDPSRNNSGRVAVFPDKFFVPYFTISWAVISIENYKKIMKLIERDENIVEYYDQTDNSYKTAKFYAQQPTYNKLYSMEKRYNMVLNLQIVFAGTLNDVGDITVEYNTNGGIGTVKSQTGVNGEEFVIDAGTTISRLNYVLSSWNTMADGSGVNYNLGDIGVFTSNITLYAQWSRLESYTLSLAYGQGSIPKDKDDKDINSVPVKYNVAIQGLPEEVVVLDPNKDHYELKDKDGNPVFTFIGWNKLAPSVGEGTYVNNGDLYNIQGNSTIYAHFDVREYTITFNSNGGTQFDSISGEYLTKISLPSPKKEGYTFAGWFTDSELTTRFSRDTIPYENITLYAKWSEA